MIEKKLRDEITKLVKREVVPALGCTEPAAVSLCVAKATEMLGNLPDKIFVKLSANMLKNAMGVGIPGTGMIGCPDRQVGARTRGSARCRRRGRGAWPPVYRRGENRNLP